MKKWQDLAAPDDPNSYNAVTCMWPTNRGTYETADTSTATSPTGPATTITHVKYAYAYGYTVGVGTEEYVVMLDNSVTKIYSWDGTNFTARLTTTGTNCPMMVKYGAVTLATRMGSGGGPTYNLYVATSFAGNFSSVAAAPAYQLIAVQSNAVLMFDAGGPSGAGNWAASDVGDYTNWTTGESASGTVYAPQGGFTACVAYGNDVYAFKSNSIHRFTYVGGLIKWQVQTAWIGNGVPYSTVGNGVPYQDWAVATKHGIVFYGGTVGNGEGIYLFDGSSPPRRLNPLTTIPISTIRGVMTYNPIDDVLCIAPSQGSSATGLNASSASSLYYYYSFDTDAWGAGPGNADEIPASPQTSASGVVRGDWANRFDGSPKPTFWMVKGDGTTAARRSAPSAPGSSSSCSVQTMKYGKPDRKTQFNRVTPLMRRRTDLGTDSATLTMELFREREGTAQSSRSVSESSFRRRFDNLGGASVDNYARFTVTWAALDVEVDDVLVLSQDMGAE